jgi:hypothetical protein
MIRTKEFFMTHLGFHFVIKKKQNAVYLPKSRKFVSCLDVSLSIGCCPPESVAGTMQLFL